jgi:hypothetical protein
LSCSDRLYGSGTLGSECRRHIDSVDNVANIFNGKQSLLHVSDRDLEPTSDVELPTIAAVEQVPRPLQSHIDAVVGCYSASPADRRTVATSKGALRRVGIREADIASILRVNTFDGSRSGL